jgi:RHS repeat-associated protein
MASARLVGLDFFGARYFSAAQGRFTSPDEFTGGIVDPFTGQQVGQPGPLPYADITDPQTLNKYAYVRNNPLRYVDPDGHWLTAADVWNAARWVGAASAAAGTTLSAMGAAALGAAGGVVVYLASPEVAGNIPSPNPGHYHAEAVDNNMRPSQQQGQSQQAQGQSTPAAPDPGKGPQKSKPEQIADQVENGGFKVTQNPKTPNQEGNVTITHPSEPGTRLNVRVETHPIPGSNGQPVRHANVEVVKPGPKNRPRVVSNEHIDQ